MFVFPIFLALLAHTGHCNIQLIDNAQKFSIQLMYFTAQGTNWHTVISPMSVWSSLSEIIYGANNDCRSQLKKNFVSHFRKTISFERYKKFVHDVIRTSAENVELRRKNFLFIDVEANLNEDFLREMQKRFHTKVKQLDFKLPKNAAETSNKVIGESIRDIGVVFTPDDFNSSSAIIMTNLITFKGLWQFPFDASITKTVPFHDDRGREIGKVNMMQQQGCFSFMKMDIISALVLELPYGNDKVYSFLVILPFAGVKLDTVYGHFEHTSVRDILSILNSNVEQNGMAFVTVNLPRFHINTNVALNKPLQNMGISDIFDPETKCFSPISHVEDVHISSIIHKAKIEVTETGTYAYASRLLEKCTPTNSRFVPDRPFLYFIVEKSTAAIIFSGAYSKPTVY